MLIDEVIQNFINLMSWFEKFNVFNDFILDHIMLELEAALKTAEKGQTQANWLYKWEG